MQASLLAAVFSACLRHPIELVVPSPLKTWLRKAAGAPRSKELHAGVLRFVHSGARYLRNVMASFRHSGTETTMIWDAL